MAEPVLSVREIQQFDIDPIMHYWLNADTAYLTGMGVEVSKLPTHEQFLQFLSEQMTNPVEQKRSYCVVWVADGKPVGHSNTNPTVFGEEALMHLHLWNIDSRKKGWGTRFVQMTLPLFFENLQLKNLYCQPYALNPSPNRVLEKAGFELEKEFITIPGAFNFEQPVKRWHMSREMFNLLK